MALRVGLPHNDASAIHWASLVAETKNFYGQEGVEVQTVPRPVVEDQTDELLSGGIALMRRGSDADIMLAEAGHPIRIIAGLVLKPSVELFTRPEITGAEQLRGRACGTVSPKNGSSLALRMYLTDRGLADGAYQNVVYGDTVPRLQALRDGKVDAALLAPPWTYRAQQEGFTCLAKIADHYPRFLYSSVQANLDAVRNDRNAVVRFLRAIIRAQRWLYDSANKGEAIAMLARGAGMTEEESRATYAEMVERSRVYAEAGEIGPANVQSLLDGLRRVGDLPNPRLRPEEYLDLSFLSEARTGLG